MKLLNAFVLLALASSAANAAAPTQISTFFQDWKLDPTQTSSAGCGQLLSGYEGTDVPGTQGQPHASLDGATSIRFVPDDSEAPAVFTLGTNPSQFGDGNENVSVSNGVLTILEQDPFSFFRKLFKQKQKEETYTLSPNGNLEVVNSLQGNTTACHYQSAHPEKVGMVEVGAILLNNGVQIAQCSFVPASPRADQVNYVYNESCTFGKYTIKQIINDDHTVVSSELVQNDNAINETQIVRSTNSLNTESENYFSRDTEIAVTDSDVDQVYSESSEYFISPLRTTTYPIDGTHATIVLQFAPAQN